MIKPTDKLIALYLGEGEKLMCDSCNVWVYYRQSAYLELEDDEVFQVFCTACVNEESRPSRSKFYEIGIEI